MDCERLETPIDAISHRLVGFRRCAKGGGHFLGRVLLWHVSEILRADKNMALRELGNGFRAPGNTYRSHSHSANVILPLRKGRGAFSWAGVALAR